MDSRIKRGRKRAVRGRVVSRTPAGRPPHASNSYRSLPTAPQLPALDTHVKVLTLFERLGGTSENPAPSKFGGTTMERAADNAAAELGFSFDAAQVTIPLTMNGSYTVVDRVLGHTLVYLDGPQHLLRADAEQQDLIQKVALESMAYLVVRISYLDMQRDPLGAIRQVLYAQ